MKYISKMEDSVLGDWVVHGEFTKEAPFEHVVIENFLKNPISIPDPDSSWNKYSNPIEKKFVTNTFSSFPEWKRVVDSMQSHEFVMKLSDLTGINLESDPHLHGAGLHATPSGGKLDIHLDYEIHPVSKKQRRINIILYMNEEWKSEWGGALELWDKDRTKCVKKVEPGWNTAIIFKTSGSSYHGHPQPLSSPEGTFRKSLAMYYVSEPEPWVGGGSPRMKAEFFPLPGQQVDPRLAKLYDIRKQRLITTGDLEDWPEWEKEGGGWW
jgi:hypothetical protein